MPTSLASRAALVLIAAACLHCGDADEPQADEHTLGTLEACGVPDMCGVLSFTYSPSEDDYRCVFSALGSGEPAHFILRFVADGGPNCGSRTDIFSLGNGSVMVLHGPDEESCKAVDGDDDDEHVWRLDRCTLKEPAFYEGCAATIPEDQYEEMSSKCSGSTDWYRDCVAAKPSCS